MLLSLPDYPEPTSYSLTQDYHINAKKILTKCHKILNVDSKNCQQIQTPQPHDVPGNWFKGPF